MKAGYNLQIATEGQYVLAYDIFPNPTDTRTFIPFLNKIEKNYFSLPKHIVADAGYGSEQNYDDVLNLRKRIPLITYNQYRKEKKKKFKNDPFKTENWEYDKKADSFIFTNLIGKINMVLKGHLKCTNAKIVHYDHYAQKRQKEKSVKYITIKSGNTKKSM